MSLSRTHRFWAAALAAMLLFGGAVPLVQHVCAQLGMEMAHACCHYNGDMSSDPHDAEHHPCDEEEALDELAFEPVAMVCCSGDVHAFESPPALLPEQDMTAAALVASPIAIIDLPDPGEDYSRIAQSRAPPSGPAAPLFILHEAFLN